MPENIQDILYIFIGGILGFIFSWAIYWHSSYRTAKAHLISTLVSMLDFEFFDLGQEDSISRYKRTFSEVYAAFIIFRETLPTCAKRKATKEWEKYAGGVEFLSLQAYEINSNKEADKRIKDFLEYLGAN